MTIAAQESLFGSAPGAPAGRSTELGADSPERFEVGLAESTIVRSVLRRNGEWRMTSIPHVARPVEGGVLSADFDKAWLMTPSAPNLLPIDSLRVADLFSGCGALSLGVAEACRALGLGFSPVLAVDMDQTALSVYSDNFHPAWSHHGPVEALLDSRVGQPLSLAELEFRRRVGPIDLVVGGPPCQGHSNLNNHTRRADPKNALYLRMARFAEVVQPTHMIVENVPGAVHDVGEVVQETVGVLHRLGYRVETVVLRAEMLGVAQRRRRFFTVASRTAPLGLSLGIPRYYRPQQIGRAHV